MKKDSRYSRVLRAIHHYLLFFLVVAFVTTCCMMLFVTILANTRQFQRKG